MPTPRALRLAASAFVLLVSLGGAGPARAQRGVDVETFHPATDGFGVLTVDRAETGHRGDFGFQLFVDFAGQPFNLPLKNASGTPTPTQLFDWQLVAHAGVHYSIFDWLEAALIIPVSMQSYTAAYGTNSDPLSPTGFYRTDPASNVGPPNASPLDLTLALKARAPRIGPLGLALVVAGTAPFGDDSAFLGDTGYTLRPTGVADLTFGKLFTVAVNAGWIFRQTTVVLDPSDVLAKSPKPATLIELGDEFTFSVGAALRPIQVRDFGAGIAAEVYGLAPLAPASNPVGRAPAARADVVLDALAGINLYPGKALTISVGGGLGLLDSYRHDAFRGFLGISWVPGAGEMP